MGTATRPVPRLRFKRLNVPTQLTVVRLLLVPVFVAIFLVPVDQRDGIAAGIFALACATDFLDGYLARRWHQTTAFGAFLDPIADKLIVVAALVVLLWTHANVWLAVPALIIIAREIGISALRELMASQQVRELVRVTWLGKCKTTLQMVALFTLLLHDPNVDAYFTWVGYITLYLAAAVTVWSLAQYLVAAWPTITRMAHAPPHA